MIILPPVVPIGAADEKNRIFASNLRFLRPFFDVSTPIFLCNTRQLGCVLHNLLGGGGALGPLAEAWVYQSYRYLQFAIEEYLEIHNISSYILRFH